MRNYLELLNIHRDTEKVEKSHRIADVEIELDDAFRDDMTAVLGSKTRAMHYRRLHLQYEAMATALTGGIPQQDSNSWSQRLVEFEPTANELPD